MRIGVVAPMFHNDARRCVDFARRSEELGFDSVSVFDHLFPLQQPDRPALAWLPTLVAMGQATETISLFPLIARVGIRPNRLLAQECATVKSLFGERFIAALGIGDSRARGEYEAYGVEYKSFDGRLNDAELVCQELKDRGVCTWVSAKSDVIQRRLAPYVSGINVWEGTVDDIAAIRSTVPGATVSWGGVWNPDIEPDEELIDSGVDWLVFSFARDAEIQVEQVAKWRASAGM